MYVHEKDEHKIQKTQFHIFFYVTKYRNKAISRNKQQVEYGIESFSFFFLLPSHQQDH